MKTTKQNDVLASEKLQNAIAHYLDQCGWKVLVAGELQVRQDLADNSANYEFVMRFTGAKCDEAKR